MEKQSKKMKRPTHLQKERAEVRPDLNHGLFGHQEDTVATRDRIHQPGSAPSVRGDEFGFVYKWIFVCNTEESDINKALMLQHLQELIEDAEVYGWRVVRDYRAAWLHQI